MSAAMFTGAGSPSVFDVDTVFQLRELARELNLT